MVHPAIIIGGGITGLSAAYYLNKTGIRPTLVEKSKLGGVIQTEQLNGCLLELGPDSFLAAKPWATELIQEVGLADDIIGSNDHLRVTYIVKHGRLRPMPDGMAMMVPTKIIPLIKTDLLSWPTKVRMGLELFRRPSRPQPDRSVADFLRDHYGQEAVDYLAEPLLSGVFGGDPEQLSANSVLTRFVELESQFGSLSRGVLAAPKPKTSRPGASLFRTLKGGLGDLVQRLAPSANLIQGEAEAIERSVDGWRVRVEGGWLECSKIFIAAPAFVAGRLLAPLHRPLGQLLAAIPYNSSLTVCLGYDQATFGRSLTGFGFLIPQRERRSLKACTWVNNKFNFRVAEGKVLLRCFFGGELIHEDDTSIVNRAKQELQTFIGLTAEPAFTRVARWPEAMAQYTVGHAQRVEQITQLMQELPGIEIGGNGYRGIGIPDCIHSGKLAAERIAKQLAGRQLAAH